MQGIYREIQKEYEDNRNKALADSEARKAKVYTQEPKLKDIDEKIKEIGIRMTKSIIFTDDDVKRENDIKELKDKIEKLKEEKVNILKHLNMNETYFEPEFQCKVCQDTGIIGGIEGAKNCVCFRQKIINHTYNGSQIYNMEKENFDTFNEKVFSDKTDSRYGSEKSPRENILAIKKRAEAFIQNFENPETKNLLFFGGTGLGKTFLSNCIAKALLDNGKTVLYQTSGKLMDTVMDYRKNRDDGAIDAAQYNELFNVDLLIIDDLGTENMTDARRAELFNILNTRLNSKKKGIKTLISTNKELKDLGTYYDQRIVSRILGNFDVCRFFGDDIRLMQRH